jgi:preprotein translocase subunit SecB
MSEPNPQPQIVFVLEKIYTKDSSYEAPNAPQVFLEPKAPEVSVQLSVGHTAVDVAQGLYEALLTVTVTAKHDDKSVFLVEVHQAGLFRIQNVPGEDLPKVMEIACPNVLLPFARQTINALVEGGGFPQLLISPVNFEALHMQKRASAAATPAH